MQGTTTSTIDNNLTLDPPSVIQCVSDRISISRSDSASYALSLLIHNWFKLAKELLSIAGAPLVKEKNNW